MFSENSNLKNLQEELLVLLKKFHKLCIDNDIKYTLHGGSMLGAIREKGFISWDDDADIALMREEYDKLLGCITTDKDEEIYLDNFSDKMYKVWMKRKNKPRVWLDIFVYDYISENTFARRLKFLGITLLTPFAKNEVSIKQFRENDRAKGLYKYIYEFLYLVGKRVSQKRKVRMIDKFEKMAFLGDKTYIHRSNDQLFAMKMVIKSLYMCTYVLVPFEDTELMISENYHEILISSYGEDYMVPKKMVENNRIHDLARENY